MAYGQVRHLAARFDAKQVICTVIGGVFGVGLIFLVGIHIGKQVGGRMPGEPGPGASGDAAASATLSVDDSAVAAASEEASQHDYRFFALLDAPAPTRALPEVELAMNPVLEERQNRRNRKKDKDSTANANEPAAAAPKAAVERAPADEPAPPRAVVASAPAAERSAGAPQIDRILAASPAANARAALIAPEPASAPEPAAKKQQARAEERSAAREEKKQRRARFTVQVSAFQDKSVADALAADFRRRGHKVHVKHEEIPGRGNWYRVQVGRFDSREDAAGARATIKQSDGYDGFVTSM